MNIPRTPLEVRPGAIFVANNRRARTPASPNARSADAFSADQLHWQKLTSLSVIQVTSQHSCGVYFIAQSTIGICAAGKARTMKSPVRNTLLLGVLLGLAIGLGGYTFIYSKGYSYLTNNPAACANCHVMRAQYDAWLKSSHRSAATCNDCHTPHNIFGKYAVKANNGFWHSFYFTTGWYPDTIEITKFDHRVTENACRRCHQNITAAIDGNVVHGKAQGIECTRCHASVGHSEAAAAIPKPVLVGSNHD